MERFLEDLRAREPAIKERIAAYKLYEMVTINLLIKRGEVFQFSSGSIETEYGRIDVSMIGAAAQMILFGSDICAYVERSADGSRSILTKEKIAEFLATVQQ